MQVPKIKDCNLNYVYRDFVPRNKTDVIIVHHTGNEVDDDLSAARINDIHKGNGWTGIGYHFVIRKDGTVEKGRPHWTIGAHAQGHNYNSIGIHVCGNFNIGNPTKAQIESLAMLVNYLAYEYQINLEEKNVVIGHRVVNSTACPGNNLYDLLPTVVGKAKWYRNN